MNVCVRHTETDSMRGEDKRSEKESVRERMTLCGPVSDRMRENVCERERERERGRKSIFEMLFSRSYRFSIIK